MAQACKVAFFREVSACACGQDARICIHVYFSVYTHMAATVQTHQAAELDANPDDQADEDCE